MLCVLHTKQYEMIDLYLDEVLPSEIYKFLYYLMGPLHAVQWNGERRVFFIVYLLFILLFTVALHAVESTDQ